MSSNRCGWRAHSAGRPWVVLILSVRNPFISFLPESTDVSGFCDGVERERSERDARQSVALTVTVHILLTDSMSNGDHPFHEREYIVAGITTTERENVISLSDEA